MLRDRRKVLVALCRGGSIRNRRHARWNNNRGCRMARGDSIIHRRTIICAIRRQRCHVGIDLSKQMRYLRDVTNIVRC